MWFQCFILFCLFLIVVCTLSKRCQYFIKVILYFLYISLVSVLILPLFLFSPFDVRNLIKAAYFCKPISTVLGIRWILKGEEYLKDKNSYIIVSNHQSSVDVLGMFNIWSVMGKCTAIARKEIFYVFPFGIAAWLAGLIFIDRKNSDVTKSKLIESALWAKQNKVKLWVFPEGTRRESKKIHEFKKGAFHMAISAEIPILPVVFSSYYFLNSREKRFDSGNVIINVLPPIDTKGMTQSNIEDLMCRTKTIMEETLVKTNKEIESFKS